MGENRPGLINISLHQDDRGYVYCILDKMHELGIRRVYTVENFNKDMVRAWHSHERGDTYIHVLNGVIKAAAMKIDDYSDVTSFVMTDRKPQLFFIPAGFYNGTKSLTHNVKLLVLSTHTFEDVKKDDKRLDWSIRWDIWKVENR